MRVKGERASSDGGRGGGVRGRASEELDAAFVAFVDRRARQHVRAAALLTGDWHTAEDLVQTCLVKLYRAWPRLDSRVDLDAYLRRMVVNTHRSWWRARWRREAPVARVPDRVGEADGQDGHARAADVRQALRALPARQRAVLVLRFYDDLPVAEVADLLGCSAGAVKTHTHRGIRKLRHLLGEEAVAGMSQEERDGARR
jgi:RNA polymerase sigma-70 factor (sigma-E family)